MGAESVNFETTFDIEVYSSAGQQFCVVMLIKRKADF
jgi:hypothetical protein